jgi:hypothetical protein
LVHYLLLQKITSPRFTILNGLRTGQALVDAAADEQREHAAAAEAARRLGVAPPRRRRPPPVWSEAPRLELGRLLASDNPSAAALRKQYDPRGGSGQEDVAAAASIQLDPAVRPPRLRAVSPSSTPARPRR